jgi:hypothetical protein
VGNQAIGSPVDKVEISLDGGKTWQLAQISAKEQNKKYPEQKIFSWILWEHKIDVRDYLLDQGTL